MYDRKPWYKLQLLVVNPNSSLTYIMMFLQIVKRSASNIDWNFGDFDNVDNKYNTLFIFFAISDSV